MQFFEIYAYEMPLDDDNRSTSSSSSNQCTGTITDTRSIEAINIEIFQEFFTLNKNPKSNAFIYWISKNDHFSQMHPTWLRNISCVRMSVCPYIWLSLCLSRPRWVFKTHDTKKVIIVCHLASRKKGGDHKREVVERSGIVYISWVI